MRIKSGLGERADADPVCFVLITAREIDLLLSRSSLRHSHAGLDRVGISTCCAENQGAQH